MAFRADPKGVTQFVQVDMFHRFSRLGLLKGKGDRAGARCCGWGKGLKVSFWLVVLVGPVQAFGAITAFNQIGSGIAEADPLA